MDQETKVVFADDLLTSVFNEDKIVTIRKGFRHYPIGQRLEVYSASGTKQKYELIPVRVTWCRAKDVPEMLFLEDGFENLNHMYEGMRSYYNGFNENTGTTVLEFTIVK